MDLARSPMLNPRTQLPDPQKVLYWRQAERSDDPFGASLQLIPSKSIINIYIYYRYYLYYIIYYI